MTLDQRLTQAVRHVAEGVVVPEVDLAAVRSRARTNRRRMVSVAAVGAVVAVLVAGTALVGGRDVSAPAPPSSTLPPPSTVSPTTSPLPPSNTVPSSGPRPRPAIDTTSWTRSTSSWYGFTVAHPPEWTEVPGSRDWRWETDVDDHRSPAHDAFVAPNGAVRVSVWFAPFDPGTLIESAADIEAWVEDYCEASGNTPCTGIGDRAVGLCLEKWDCHPGLLVPFRNSVQAFFSGGIYDSRRMTVVAVWRGESAPAVAPHGGSQRLLEAFLSTMQVWPSTTPRWQRR